jgi:hypothetical protein
MTTTQSPGNEEPEFSALVAVYNALKPLTTEAQQRVLGYVSQKLGLPLPHTSSGPADIPGWERADHSITSIPVTPEVTSKEEDEYNAISPVAKKWMTRNGLTATQLTAIFSVKADEIDLIAKTVPGNSKNKKTRGVALLKCIAEYLSSGASRVSHEAIKEACLHYDAYDGPNHAKYLRDMSSELSGTKESGYNLTPRGITAATDMIKEMLAKREP